MKGQWIPLWSVVSVVVLVLVTGLTQAQGPQGGASPQAGMGTAFTYQGQLRKDGNPVSGTCDFQFSLWDAASGGTQVGTTWTKTGVQVTNGYFTIPDLDFGAGAFQSDARWLEIAVACTGDLGYTTLSPRQRLTPAPYALALPGLWTQQNATSPNLIGGYSGNSVDADIYGATISGGGALGWTNAVTGHFSTVGGGRGNVAGEWGATVGGGMENKAPGQSATIGGGNQNTANGYVATISGGGNNAA
ncbi:MAG: hypothetical protein N2508_00880, partial [Anaerolineae bacterium]|nr:hypothetical protein [Anaerolineae bacterium]